MLSWGFVPQPWYFDVSSLMILIGENEEMNYRLSRRSLLECTTAAPVIGLQAYIRSYNLLQDTSGSKSYFSPYGCKTSLLRNLRLQNAIELNNLLDDKRYSVYRIPPSFHPSNTAAGVRAAASLRSVVKWLWFLFSWLSFAGIIVFLFYTEATWIGFINCVILSGWSIIVRLVEYNLVRPASSSKTASPDNPDAIFILGRNQSAFVLEGSRQDVKNNTSCGLSYGEMCKPLPAAVCQAFTRTASLLVLIVIFATIPNGTTMDQTAFILLNLLGQANVLVGRWLNSWAYLEGLKRLPESSKNVQSRTHIYGRLLRRFRHVGKGDNAWVEVAGLLPKTDVWDKWKKRVVEDENRDAKSLYEECVKEEEEGAQ